MKKIKKWTLPALGLGLLVSLGSCSEMDEYKEFTEGGEINYTEKVDSVEVYSGRNRVMIEGVIMADPKVSEYRIYWNSKNDSLVVPRENEGVDTLSTIIEGLAENIYNFEIRTFDEEGNNSIPVFTSGEVFGERYQSSLIQRPLISNALIGSNLTINYAGMDRTSGVIGTEVEYTTVAGEEQTEFIPIDSTNVIVENFQGGSEYQYRTVFLPEPTSIDTFYTEYEAYTPQFQLSDPPYFENASYPYELGDDSGGRWNTPAGWIHNDAALSHNGYGALDWDLFDVEAGWGQPNIDNGKVYQTFVLEPGTYAYIIDIRELNYVADDQDHAYFVVADGSTLPDVSNVESSGATLVHERIHRDNGLYRTLTFTIDEVTQVSVGIAATLRPTGGGGRYLKIDSFALGEIAQPPYLENTSFPFEASADGGRWATPAGWTHNEAALSHGGYGAMDANAGDRFSLESGWGQPNITNGKVYQTLILEPGTYTYSIDIFETNHQGRPDIDQTYFTVARGATLPDVADVEESEAVLAYELIDPDNLNPTIQFTLEEITQVSIGAQTTLDGSEAGKYLKISSFSLTQE